jgi:hypothetical protein
VVLEGLLMNIWLICVKISVLVLENHICLSENVNPRAVELFPAIDRFLSNFAQIDNNFYCKRMTE